MPKNRCDSVIRHCIRSREFLSIHRELSVDDNKVYITIVSGPMTLGLFEPRTLRRYNPETSRKINTTELFLKALRSTCVHRPFQDTINSVSCPVASCFTAMITTLIYCAIRAKFYPCVEKLRLLNNVSRSFAIWRTHIYIKIDWILVFYLFVQFWVLHFHVVRL